MVEFNDRRTSTRCQHTEDGLQCNRIEGHETSQYEQNRGHAFYDPKTAKRGGSKYSSYGADSGLFGSRQGYSGGFSH